MTVKIFYKRKTNRYYIVVKRGRFSFTAVGDNMDDIFYYMYYQLLTWDITGYEANLYHTTIQLDYGIIL